MSEHAQSDVRAFSGIPHFMARAIASEAELAAYIQVPLFDLELMLSDPIAGRRQLRELGEGVSSRLKGVRADLVICQGSSMIPFLRTEKTVVLWHDSMWHALMQVQFEDFTYSYPLLHEWDSRVLETCDVVAFAAEWVRQETLVHHPVDTEKIAVVPFGANVEPEDVPTEQDVRGREPFPCQLTFIGLDWARKGLPLAHAVMSDLNRAGVPSVLNVVGCSLDRPPDQLGWAGDCGELLRLRLRSDKRMNTVGFLSKDSERDRRTLSEIMRRSHFLLHPASFECYGVALAEASAFGVPVLATDRFGPRSIVKEGVNGRLFEIDDFRAAAGDFIRSRMEEYELYRVEALAALREYGSRLNWPAATRELLGVIARML